MNERYLHVTIIAQLCLFFLAFCPTTAPGSPCYILLSQQNGNSVRNSTFFLLSHPPPLGVPCHPSLTPPLLLPGVDDGGPQAGGGAPQLGAPAKLEEALAHGGLVGREEGAVVVWKMWLGLKRLVGSLRL